MPDILEVKTIHTGYNGAPGYTQHYFSGDADPAESADHIRDFWEACAPQFAANWRYNIQPDVTYFDEASGTMTGIAAVTPVAQGTFGGSANVAAGVGACAGWVTAAVIGGRHLRGRTFIVPLNADAYDADGTLNGISLPALRSAAADLAATGTFGVWHRPVAGSGGAWSLCLAGVVRDQVAYLSSRRT